jgi:hypothetical protein
VTAVATMCLLALVVWMDAADVSAEAAAWITAGVIGAVAVVGLAGWALRRPPVG